MIYSAINWLVHSTVHFMGYLQTYRLFLEAWLNVNVQLTPQFQRFFTWMLHCVMSLCCVQVEPDVFNMGLFLVVVSCGHLLVPWSRASCSKVVLFFSPQDICWPNRIARPSWVQNYLFVGNSNVFLVCEDS